VRNEPGRFEVVLVRHGETAWSLSGRHTGRTDVPLTAEGRRQAKLISSRFTERSFAQVLTSPLSRAADTCDIAGFSGVSEKTDDLLEWDYGDYDGRRTVDIRRERPGWSLWTDGVPNGEAAEEVARRADRVIAAVRAARGDVALFAHGHLLRVLAARWLGAAPQEGRRFALGPATLSVLGWEREVPVIARWNDASHLEEGWCRGNIEPQ
jgi:broad specificity phosphatase PhoE